MKIDNRFYVTISCFLAGFMFIHPLTMLLGQIMHEIESSKSNASLQQLIFGIFRSYSLEMLPWGMIFGGLSGMVGYYFISLKKQKELLKNANITKEKFVSIIAHDLRNPFLPIIGFADLLLSRSDDFDENKKKQCLIAIRDSALHIHKTLENLLEWSRVQSGQIEVHRTKIKLHDLVKEIMLLLEANADRKKISVQSLVETDTMILGDLSMISLILNHLLQNAIKFTQMEGSIEISASTTGKFVEIIVKDTGIGMTEAEMKDLFRIDLKKSNPGTNNEPGTGLGLILCRGFTEKNGGKISVRSIPGEGSQFIVKLPACKK